MDQNKIDECEQDDQDISTCALCNSDINLETGAFYPLASNIVSEEEDDESDGLGDEDWNDTPFCADCAALGKKEIIKQLGFCE